MHRFIVLYRLFTFAAIIFSGFHRPSLLAQDSSTWNVYMAQYPNGIGSTLVNLSYHSKAPVQKAPYCVIIGAAFSGCNYDGMPMAVTMPELYRFSDSVALWMNRKTENHFVGVFTYRCERSDYYYVTDTTGLRSTILGKLKTNYFTFLKPYIAIQTDSFWNLYRTFIYPKDEALESMLNKDVILRLNAAGDPLTKERKIEHWAYFPTAEDRECYVKYVLKNNFIVEQKDTTGSITYPFKLVFSRVEIPKLEPISKLTLSLREEAVRCKGEYDGWESPVMK